MKEELENRYWGKDKELKVVIEEMKQRAVAKSPKLTTYEARRKEYVQNRNFQMNHKRKHHYNHCQFEKKKQLQYVNT